MIDASSQLREEAADSVRFTGMNRDACICRLSTGQLGVALHDGKPDWHTSKVV